MAILIFRLVLLIAVLAPLVATAEVVARLEKDTITLEETATLVIESNDINSNVEPDLSALREQFNLLGTSSTQQISIVNGQQNLRKRWLVELEPKSHGSFTIGPIILGTERTAPLKLTVRSIDGANDANSPGVYLEMEADLEQAFVQQQVVLTVRLYIGVDLINGSLTDPQLENTLVTRLGDDIQYDAQRNDSGADNNYRVIERSYALFPQSSGSLDIPALRFQGTIRDTTQPSSGMFDRIFNQGKRVRAKTNQLSLNILPPSQKFTGTHWLPANSLRLTDLSSDLDDYQVGRPITRTIQVQAEGLTAEQLPEPGYPASDDFSAYPDKPVLETQQNGRTVVGMLLKSVALVPTKAGEITIPAVSLKWWNTKTQTTESATIPAKNITVLNAVPNDTSTPPLASTLDQISGAPQTDLKIQNSRINDARTDGIWKWLSLGLLLAWVSTLVFLFRTKSTDQTRDKNRQSIGGDKIKATRLLQNVKYCALRNDALGTRTAILTWAKLHWQHNPPGSIAELATRLDQSAIQQALNALDQHLYAKSSKPWSGGALWALFSQHANQEAGESTSRNSVSLPPLYPQTS